MITIRERGNLNGIEDQLDGKFRHLSIDAKMMFSKPGTSRHLFIGQGTSKRCNAGTPVARRLTSLVNVIMHVMDHGKVSSPRSFCHDLPNEPWYRGRHEQELIAALKHATGAVVVLVCSSRSDGG